VKGQRDGWFLDVKAKPFTNWRLTETAEERKDLIDKNIDLLKWAMDHEQQCFLAKHTIQGVSLIFYLFQNGQWRMD